MEELTTGSWKPLSSGSEIVDNTQLRLTAIGLPADSTVQSWTVGKTNIPAEGHELTYIVRKADANDNNIVTIYYTERKSVNLKINFDAAQVKVEAEQAGTWNTLTSGSTVQENTRLRLTALAVPAGKLIDVWKFGKTTLSGKGYTFEQTAALSHAENDIIAISYTLRDILNLTLNFDAAQVKVEAEQAGTWNALTSGSTVQENTRLRLTALAVPAGKFIDVWKFGKTTLSGKGSTFEQTAELSHAENNTITVSYTLRDIVNLTLNFDTTKLKVEAEQAGTWNALTSGSTVQEHTRLRLTAIGLPPGTPVQAWKIGNTIIPAEGSELIHTVRKVDADSSNRVALAYTVKSDKLIIAFDKTKVRVFAYKGGIVRDGGELTVGMKLYISTQNLTAGQIVDTWKIGKRNISADSNDCEYTVMAEDAESGIIAISYTTKPAQKFTLNFDGSKMTVQERKEDGPWQILSNGTQVEEGTPISIKANDMPVGHIVKEWTIGKRTFPPEHKDECWAIVKSADAESGVITISYTTKPAQKFTLKFDEAKMTVTIPQQYGPNQTLSDGAQVEEGTGLSIEAKNLTDQIVNEWKIGKRTVTSSDKNQCWYNVKSADAESDTITIDYTTKPAQKFTLNFDGSKMTVTIPQQQDGSWQSLSNGAQVEEGTEVRIEAKDLPAGQIVDTWKIGKRTFEDKAEWNGNRWGFRVGSNYAEGDTISISYTTKAAKKFTLTFDESKMTVEIPQQHGPDQTLSNGAEVEEMTGIIIKAKDLPVGKIVDEWTIGKRTFEDEGNWGGNRHWFCVSPDYAEGGTITIDYTTKPAQKFTLNFDGSKMTVEMRQQGNWQSISNGAQVEKGTEVSIEAKGLPVGEVVGEWAIGKRTEKANGNRTGFRVDSDYAKDGTITIDYTTKPAQKFTLTFDAATMTVQKQQQHGPDQTLSSGAQVEEGTGLSIEAKNLPAGKIVDAWKIGKRTLTTGDKNRCWYIVQSEDAEGTGITIDYTTKDAQKFTLNFAEATMTVAMRQQGNQWQFISNGAQVEEGTEVSIEAKNLPAGQIVKEWTIGKETEEAHDGNRRWFRVGSDYAKDGTITISYKTKPAQKFTLIFDEATMTVQKQQQHGPDQTLSSGAQVEEETGISIEAKNLTGQIVDKWKIGKRTFEDKGNWGGNRWWVRVGPDYAEGGTISISYTTKTAQKFTLTFDEAKMTVTIPQQHGQGQTLANNAQVEEGTGIRIEAKNLPTGKLVDEWKIGKRTEKANENSNWFRVGSNYAEGTGITIDYTTKDAQKFTLNFDGSKMTVCISRWGEQGQILSSGAQVEEGMGIRIDAKDLAEGQIVDKWTTGKSTFTIDASNSCRYIVNPDDAENGTIAISYTTKAAQKFTLTFNESKMTVQKQQHGPGQTLSNGAQVEERTEISIEAKDLPAGQIVDEWKIGKRTFEDDKGSNRCWIRVDSDYAEGGTISISYTTKNK